MPKIVIDANIIVSSLFGGTPRKAFVKALRTCDVYISYEIRAELACLIDTLGNKLDRAKASRLRSIIFRLVSDAKEINATKKIDISRDRKDNSYLALCLKVRADYLLTGDKDLLEIPSDKLKSAGLNKLTIITPVRFLSLQ